jgi:two-component system invasion response regulator UvrY
MSDAVSGNPRKDAEGPVFVFMPPDAVPQGWAERAVTLSLIPLTPEEAQDLMKPQPLFPLLDRSELELLRLVAAGRYVEEIADALSMAPRTVFRRLAQLRRRFGVSSTAELALVLARAGF